MKCTSPFLVAFVIALAACTSVTNVAHDDWLVLGHSDADRPEVVLVVRNLPADSIRARFPMLLKIEWDYDAVPNGMPTEKEIQRGREIYSALDRIVGKDGVYAMSRTGDGGRAIYYYVSSPITQAAALRGYFDSLPPISIRVIARHEPDWHSVQDVLSAVK